MLNFCKQRFFVFFISITFFLFSFVQAQEIWNLQKCIDYAIQNNVDIQLQRLEIANAKTDIAQQEYGQLPSVNASINPALRGGQQLTPNNTGFVNQTFVFSNFSLNLNGDIYNFGSRKKLIQSSQYTLEAIEKSLTKAQNDIALNIANSYINVLLNTKQKEVFELTIQQDLYDIEQTQKLIDVGIRTDFDLIELETQLARDSANYQNAHLQVQQNLLNLKILMNMEPSTDIVIKEYTIDSLETLSDSFYNPQDVFNIAYTILPQQAIAKNNIQAAEFAYQSTKAQLLPSLTYRMGTNTTYTFDQPTIPGIDNSFFAQLSNYNNYFVQLSLNIPLYDAWSVRGPLRKAKTQIDYQKRLGEKQANQLKQEVFQACQSAYNSYQKYLADRNVYEKTEKSLKSAERRYEVGVLSINDFINQKNQTARARIQVLSSFYDYFFKQKIIDFYMGKPIQL